MKRPLFSYTFAYPDFDLAERTSSRPSATACRAARGFSTAALWRQALAGLDLSRSRLAQRAAQPGWSSSFVLRGLAAWLPGVRRVRLGLVGLSVGKRLPDLINGKFTFAA